MRHARLKLLVAGGLGSGFLVAALVSCLSDPRAGEDVSVQETCDTAKLSTDPKSAESSLHAYVDATEALAKQAAATEAAFRDACNAISKDLGAGSGGEQTAEAACAPVAARIGVVLKKQPPAVGGLEATTWAKMAFPPSCTEPPGALEACLTKCAGPCADTQCEPGKAAGKCAGTCKGSCTEKGPAVPCSGKCLGETDLTNSSCYGECVGSCASPVWTGACTASCPQAFLGFCGGTCTGKCDGVAINQPVDAGTDAGDAGDAGEAGDAEAGPPPVPVACPPNCAAPPTNGDGNCPGKCEGVCSKGANGDCAGPCLTFNPTGAAFGDFVAGFCGIGGVPGGSGGGGCTGTCRSAAGTGSTSLCNGQCIQATKAACEGTCRGGCDGKLSEAFCEGNVACGQNVECNNACRASSLLASVCTEPVTAQIFSVTDPALYAALVKNRAALGKAVNLLEVLRSANGFISNRGIGDFAALGLSGDLTRRCVDQGRKNVEAAKVALTNATNANPTAFRTAR